MIDALTTLGTAVLGGLVVFWLSGWRTQKEWRAEKRAEVMSELYRLLWGVEKMALLASAQGVSLEDRRQRIVATKKALDELLTYFGGHALWIDADTLPDIQAFVNGLSSALKHYEAEIDNGTPDSPLAVRAAEHVQRIVPEAQEVLGEQFRDIVYPTPWREYLARALEWLEAPKGKDGPR